MTTTTTPYSVISLEDAAIAAVKDGFGLTATPPPDEGTRSRVNVRRDLGIRSFGVNAYYQGTKGAPVIDEHDELSPGASGHEQLYVVAQGGCTFTVDGEEVDATAGSAVYVRDTATKRGAIATEDGTIVLAVGGRPGEPFAISPGEAIGEFFRFYRSGDHEAALAECRAGLEAYPGNALILYNIACMEALLGRTDEALEALEPALAAWPAYKELAAGDDDLASLRDEARFRSLLE